MPSAMPHHDDFLYRDPQHCLDRLWMKGRTRLRHGIERRGARAAIMIDRRNMSVIEPRADLNAPVDGEGSPHR